jgi:hypothetical protein
MKAKVYMRIASHPSGRAAPYKVAASVQPNYTPLTTGQGFSETVLPTVAFAVEFEIPESKIFAAEQAVAEIKLREEDLAVAATVTDLQED